MKLSEIMKERTAFSFEVFQPKTDKGMSKLPDTLGHLCKWKPDYISCTYGAAGSGARKNLDVCKLIQNAGTIPVTHFTIIGNTRETIKEQIQAYLDNGNQRTDSGLSGQWCESHVSTPWVPSVWMYRDRRRF